MAITMFDCGFGDSFLIEEYVDKPLLVDFGVWFKPKEKKYANVIDRIGAIQNKNFMLTHFHCDHFSGMLYWKNHRSRFISKNHMFEKVYVPAINHVSVINVLLLGNLGRRNSFLDFLTVFCRLGWRGLECVGTGNTVEGLTILWPDADPIARGSIVDYANKFLEQINQNADFRIFNEYSERLSEYINEMNSLEFDRQDEVLELIRDIKRELRRVGENQEQRDGLDEIFVEIDDNKIQLNQYKHICNIVFHNTEANNENQRNILFTGDIETSDMKKISLRTESKLELHKYYDVIKLPHHGTENHYFDFSNLCRKDGETVFLISNGKVPRKKGSLRTSEKYNISNSKVCTIKSNRTVRGWSRIKDIFVDINGRRII